MTIATHKSNGKPRCCTRLLARTVDLNDSGVPDEAHGYSSKSFATLKTQDGPHHSTAGCANGSGHSTRWLAFQDSATGVQVDMNDD
ncbi:hypothetical protein BP6252_13566 [Coleophoma cylindrospora]|uniref:Uncharacterized protein n=1 Tax=Coleophoma cylindrospora TaxID=1849047 RepID=A0A3D8Q8J0_9HELO|nr:hypothetical protein BP6252_13566 [Coleophoma cylindrospora]